MAAGLEPAARAELADLGVDAEPAGRGRLRIEAEPETAAFVWLAARAATRIVLELAPSLPSGRIELGAAVTALPWERWLPAGRTWAVRAGGRTPEFRHTLFAARWLKDRIRERFARIAVPAPPVDPGVPEILVDLRLAERGAEVGLDLGGGSLHRRAGPREAAAPLREDVAAGLAWLAGAAGHYRLVDPFCGSGTLIAEAVAVARRLPRARELPPALRCLPHFSRVDPGRLRGRLERRVRPLAAPAVAADRDASAVERARRLLVRLGLAGDVRLRRCEVARLEVPATGAPTLVLTNPPWGRRLRGEVDAAWRDLGSWARRAIPGGRLAVLSGAPGLTRPLRLRAAIRHPVRAGGVDARLCVYEIEAGSGEDPAQ